MEAGRELHQPSQKTKTNKKKYRREENNCLCVLLVSQFYGGLNFDLFDIGSCIEPRLVANSP